MFRFPFVHVHRTPWQFYTSSSITWVFDNGLRLQYVICGKISKHECGAAVITDVCSTPQRMEKCQKQWLCNVWRPYNSPSIPVIRHGTLSYVVSAHPKNICGVFDMAGLGSVCEDPNSPCPQQCSRSHFPIKYPMEARRLSKYIKKRRQIVWNNHTKL